MRQIAEHGITEQQQAEVEHMEQLRQERIKAAAEEAERERATYRVDNDYATKVHAEDPRDEYYTGHEFVDQHEDLVREKEKDEEKESDIGGSASVLLEPGQSLEDLVEEVKVFTTIPPEKGMIRAVPDEPKGTHDAVTENNNTKDDFVIRNLVDNSLAIYRAEKGGQGIDQNNRPSRYAVQITWDDAYDEEEKTQKQFDLYWSQYLDSSLAEQLRISGLDFATVANLMQSQNPSHASYLTADLCKQRWQHLGGALEADNAVPIRHQVSTDSNGRQLNLEQMEARPNHKISTAVIPQTVEVDEDDDCAILSTENIRGRLKDCLRKPIMSA